MGIIVQNPCKLVKGKTESVWGEVAVNRGNIKDSIHNPMLKMFAPFQIHDFLQENHTAFSSGIVVDCGGKLQKQT